MSVDKFPSGLLTKLGLKVFSVNDRQGLAPNLWCLCSIHITPKIIQVAKQHISFSLLAFGQEVYFSAVYASTSHVSRKDLWSDLNSIQ